MDNSTRPTGPNERTKRPERTLADLQANPPRWFTIPELMTWFGLSEWSVEKLIREKALISNKIGGNRRVSYENLLAYEKATEDSPVAASAR